MYYNLIDLREFEDWRLRLLIADPMPVASKEPPPVPGAVRLDVTDDSPLFELVWPDTLIYQVRRESNVCFRKTEQYEKETEFLCRHVRSLFLDHAAQAVSFYPEVHGGGQDYKAWRIVCNDQVIDVAAIDPPTITRHSYSVLASLLAE